MLNEHRQVMGTALHDSLFRPKLHFGKIRESPFYRLTSTFRGTLASHKKHAAYNTNDFSCI